MANIMIRKNFNLNFINISLDEAGQRVDNFLRIYLKGLPKSMIYRILRKGEVRVNKKKIKPKYKLQYNDKLFIPPVQQLEKKQIPFSIKLNKISALNKAILYEDDSVLILSKPAGTAVHGGSYLKFGIIEALRALRPNAYFLELVHRLDRDTSGVLLIAKKRSSLRILHEQLRTKNMQKEYLALVHGHWQSRVKVVKVPLIKNIFTSGERIVKVSKKGKISETHFKVEERFTLATLIKANLITGRTHQIRVHTQYIGHPIAFDNLYGNSLFDRKLIGCGLNRPFLHASKLRFDHPDSGRTLKIEAPLDESLYKCLVYLRDNYK